MGVIVFSVIVDFLVDGALKLLFISNFWFRNRNSRGCMFAIIIALTTATAFIFLSDNNFHLQSKLAKKTIILLDRWLLKICDCNHPTTKFEKKKALTS